MSNFEWPDDLAPRTFSLKLNTSKRVGSAALGGSEKVTDMDLDYWTATMEIDSRSGVVAAKLEALVNWLQGGEHTAVFGHIARPNIRGNLSGLQILATPAAKGSDTVALFVSDGSTLLAGDMILLDGLLLQVAEDCLTIGGFMIVKLTNRLRKALDPFPDKPVTSVNPKIKFQLSEASNVGYTTGMSEPTTLSFIEAI